MVVVSCCRQTALYFIAYKLHTCPKNSSSYLFYIWSPEGLTTSCINCFPERRTVPVGETPRSELLPLARQVLGLLLSNLRVTQVKKRRLQQGNDVPTATETTLGSPGAPAKPDELSTGLAGALAGRR